MLTFQLIDGRQQVFQWETDRVIKLIGFESCDYVNFYNPFSDTDEAYTVKPFTNGDDICVVIPNEILQFDKKVRFYIVGKDEYGSYVQLDGVINLVPRQRPVDYVYEPSDILTFQKILDAAKAYRDEAEKSAEESKKSADTATKKAEESKESADSALESRKTAERFAKGTEDGVAVTEGDGFEDNAKYYKELADTARQTAETKASEALQSKNDAENAKELAKKYANADEDVVVETIEGEAQYSSKHYMKKVEKKSETVIDELESKGDEIKDYLDKYRSRGYHCPIGDGTTTQYTITHNLGTTLIQPWIIATDPDAVIPFTRFTAVDENTISVVFEWTPPANQMILCISTIKEIAESTGLPTGKIQWSQIENVKITEDQLDSSLFMSAEEANQILNS